jgi:hypothetical protein
MFSLSTFGVRRFAVDFKMVRRDTVRVWEIKPKKFHLVSTFCVKVLGPDGTKVINPSYFKTSAYSFLK